MANGEVRFEGARRLRSTLRRAGDDLTDMRRAHGFAALIAANAARGIAPVGRTGRLAASVRSTGTKTAGIIRAGNNSSVPYGPPVHWGWPRRGIPANPFLSRGAQQSESRWLPVYQTYIDNALNRIEGI